MDRTISLTQKSPTEKASRHSKSASESVAYCDIRYLSPATKANLQVSKRSIYSDNSWCLTAEYPSERLSRITLNFSKLKFLDGSRLDAPQNRDLLEIYKDFAYTLIADPPSRHPKWSTCVAALERRGFSWLLRYMASKKIFRLSELTPTDYEDFLAWITAVPTMHFDKNEHKARKGNLRSLGESDPGVLAQQRISNTTLSARTKGIGWLYQQREKMPDGLTFDPWKEYKNCSAWTQQAATSVTPRNVSLTPEMPDEVAEKLLRSALTEMADCERYVAMSIAYKAYTQKQRLNWKNFPTSRARRFEYRKIAPFIWSDYGYAGFQDTKYHRSALMSAAYIIVALLTGMRAHEILSIPVSDNWTQIEQHIDGVRVLSYFINSYTAKLHPDRTSARWQTLPIVRDVLLALEKINASYIEQGSNRIFSSPRKVSIRCGGMMGLNTINALLVNFSRKHLIFWQGELYKPSTHQFRKKFARLLFRQGLGIRELQDQLKHFDVSMTRLYGEPNLYAELQKERFQLSREIYEELLAGQIPIIGGGAKSFETVQKQFLGKTRTDRKKFLDQLAKSVVIDQVDDGLCLYNAKRALCGGEKINCKPAHCLNSVIPLETAKRNLNSRTIENQRLLRHFKNQPLKIAHLESQLETIGDLSRQAALHTTTLEAIDAALKNIKT